MSSRKLVLVSLLALGCAAEAPVPDKPTWADDVQPILQANCFHCHGATANLQDFGTRRWDIYDLADPTYADLGFAPSADPVKAPFIGAKDNPTIAAYVATPSDNILHMPPLPATPLSDRDLAVLDKWTKQAMPLKGAHHPNHKPTIAWLQKPTTFMVSDADSDQVLGNLDCGGMAVSIPRSGAGRLPAGVAPPCTGTLYDGFETASVSLK